MLRTTGKVRWLFGIGAAVAAAVVVAIILMGSGDKSASASTTVSDQASGVSGPRPLATYTEHVPHAASQLNVYGYQGSVKGAPRCRPRR